jgi:TPR repeat protein
MKRHCVQYSISTLGFGIAGRAQVDGRVKLSAFACERNATARCYDTLSLPGQVEHISRMTYDRDMALASGIAAFEAKQFTAALRHLTPHAEEGNADAQYRVAIMYQNGLGVVRNEKLAVKWMRAAAEQGHALAQHGLGYMYLQGDCLERNAAEASTWFRRAAEQGLAGSQTMLAMMYEQGNGVERDPEEAKRWYERAGSPPPSPLPQGEGSN